MLLVLATRTRYIDSLNVHERNLLLFSIFFSAQHVLPSFLKRKGVVGKSTPEKESFGVLGSGYHLPAADENIE